MSVGQLVILAAVLTFSALCSFFDIRTKSIPLWLLATGPAVIAFVKFFFERPFNLWWLLTAVIVGVFYFAVRLITHGKLGMADLFFGVVQGLVLSPFYIPICMLIECGLAALVFLIICRRAENKSLPFIPFMALGLIISYITSLCLG